MFCRSWHGDYYCKNSYGRPIFCVIHSFQLNFDVLLTTVDVKSLLIIKTIICKSLLKEHNSVNSVWQHKTCPNTIYVILHSIIISCFQFYKDECFVLYFKLGETLARKAASLVCTLRGKFADFSDSASDWRHCTLTAVTCWPRLVLKPHSANLPHKKGIIKRVYFFNSLLYSYSFNSLLT